MSSSGDQLASILVLEQVDATRPTPTAEINQARERQTSYLSGKNQTVADNTHF